MVSFSDPKLFNLSKRPRKRFKKFSKLPYQEETERGPIQLLIQQMAKLSQEKNRRKCSPIKLEEGALN